jgi:hypothetical protein
MASVYLASSVALGDLCIAPDKFIEDQASTELSKEILRYYTSCERARANPFTQRLREAKTTIENMRLNLNSLKQPAMELFPKKSLETKFSSLKNEVNSADTTITILTTAVDCRALHAHYLRGARALCNVGLLGVDSDVVVGGAGRVIVDGPGLGRFAHLDLHQEEVSVGQGKTPTIGCTVTRVTNVGL